MSSTISLNATSLRYVQPPSSSSWKDTRAYQGQYNGSSQKLGALLFSKLRDGAVNWPNQRILSIKLTCAYDGAGSNSAKTLGLWIGTGTAISGAGTNLRGTSVGDVATNGSAYNSTRTITFSPDVNPSAFAALADWIVNGSSTTLVVWRNETDGGHSWSSNYLAIKAATLLIEYEAAGSYGELDKDEASLGDTVTLRISPTDVEGVTITHTVVWRCGSKSQTVMTKGSALTSAFTIPASWHDQITGTTGEAYCELTTYLGNTAAGTMVIPLTLTIPASWAPVINGFSVERYSSHLDDQGHTVYEADPLGDHVWVSLDVSVPGYDSILNAPQLKIVYTRVDEPTVTGQYTATIAAVSTTKTNDRTVFSGSFDLSHKWRFELTVANAHTGVASSVQVSDGSALLHINRYGATFGGFSHGTADMPLLATLWPTYGFLDVAYDSGRQTKSYPNNVETSILSFNLPGDGMAMVIGIAQFPTGTGGTFRFGAVKYTRNGAETEITAQTCPPQNNAGPRICMIGVYDAKAGDVLSLRINQNSGAAVSGACQLIVLRVGGIRLG